ncbi:MAG: hypothetical protein DMF61_16655 [Blastocatellia bacterium AA13]|nr:MAG: hypothetical protein DMF61_16655 [Blastocatellia bacterium AA13]
MKEQVKAVNGFISRSKSPNRLDCIDGVLSYLSLENPCAGFDAGSVIFNNIDITMSSPLKSGGEK